MRVFFCLLLAQTCLLVLPVHAQQSGTGYAVDYDQFYSINLATRKASLIGTVSGNNPAQIADLSGLATAPDGTVYAASDTLKSLIRIDPTTGNGTVIGPFGVSLNGNPTAALDFGMTAACDGSLWLTSATARQLWKVNPGTGNATLVGALGHTITGVAVDHDKLYGVGGRGEEGWYDIDNMTGASHLLGGLGSMVDYVTSASPAFDSQGHVLAVLNYVPAPSGGTSPDWSDLASIDLDTGLTDVLGTITGPASLQGIGIRGFTLGPPQCAPPGTVQADIHGAPTLDTWASLLMLLMLLGGGCWILSRQSVKTGKT